MAERSQPTTAWRCRRLVGFAILAIGLACAAGCAAGAAGEGPRVIVLGFDGMDYGLTRRLIAEGALPNMARLAAGGGGLRPLATSVPPQSPVAWSTFITGLDPGGHGIFDFIHRDPATMVPYLSTTRTEAGELALSVGRWKLPLSGGAVELLREGTEFWRVLEDRGVETTIIRMPANFPPSGHAAHELSGMGTPDILGTYGTFAFYSAGASDREDLSGGTIFPIQVVDGVATGALVGPDHPFLVAREPVTSEFTVYLDPRHDAGKLVVGAEERLVRAGEWTDWVPVSFDLGFFQTLNGMARFYLKQARPVLELYVSPINFDPLDPAAPISTPPEYAAELAEATGRFYTQGMPEDTQSLNQAVLTPAEFLAQARIAGAEVRAQYDYVLDQFVEGEASSRLLFYYFGNLDQVSHMMWRATDEDHPAYDPVRDGPFADVVEGLYRDMDEVVGATLERMTPDTLLVIMSDHGFASWRRAFHLNAWLREEGYLSVVNPALDDDPGLFANVDWTRTRAYGLGLNGLYVNLAGRERDGIVAPEALGALLEEIRGRLLATVDPATGEPAVTRVFRRDVDFVDGERPATGPDLIVGYAGGTRCSNESALGAVPREVIVDNHDAWSGDHCTDPAAVPGILLSSRPLAAPATSLQDLAGALLAEFGIETFPEGSPVTAETP